MSRLNPNQVLSIFFGSFVLLFHSIIASSEEFLDVYRDLAEPWSMSPSHSCPYERFLSQVQCDGGFKMDPDTVNSTGFWSFCGQLTDKYCEIYYDVNFIPRNRPKWMSLAGYGVIQIWHMNSLELDSERDGANATGIQVGELVSKKDDDDDAKAAAVGFELTQVNINLTNVRFGMNSILSIRLKEGSVVDWVKVDGGKDPDNGNDMEGLSLKDSKTNPALEGVSVSSMPRMTTTEGDRIFLSTTSSSSGFIASTSESRSFDFVTTRTPIPALTTNAAADFKSELSVPEGSELPNPASSTESSLKSTNLSLPTAYPTTTAEFSQSTLKSADFGPTTQLLQSGSTVEPEHSTIRQETFPTSLKTPTSIITTTERSRGPITAPSPMSITAPMTTPPTSSGSGMVGTSESPLANVPLPTPYTTVRDSTTQLPGTSLTTGSSKFTTLFHEYSTTMSTIQSSMATAPALYSTSRVSESELTTNMKQSAATIEPLASTLKMSDFSTTMVYAEQFVTVGSGISGRAGKPQEIPGTTAGSTSGPSNSPMNSVTLTSSHNPTTNMKIPDSTTQIPSRSTAPTNNNINRQTTPISSAFGSSSEETEAEAETKNESKMALYIIGSLSILIISGIILGLIAYRWKKKRGVVALRNSNNSSSSSMSTDIPV